MLFRWICGPRFFAFGADLDAHLDRVVDGQERSERRAYRRGRQNGDGRWRLGGPFGQSDFVNWRIEWLKTYFFSEMGRFQCDQIGLFLKVLGDKFPFTILQKYNNSLCYLKNFKFRHLVTLKMGRFQATFPLFPVFLYSSHKWLLDKIAIDLIRTQAELLDLEASTL